MFYTQEGQFVSQASLDAHRLKQAEAQAGPQAAAQGSHAIRALIARVQSHLALPPMS